MAKFDVSNIFSDIKAVSESDTERALIAIDIDDIVENDANFYVVRNLDDLKSSIELSGILDPPTVVSTGEGKYRLISGHRRTAAVRELVLEGRTDLRKISCFVRSPRSAAMEELELIMANATTRVLTSPELAKQAERVTALLYDLKNQGVEFPGRMRDHVAEACNVSKTKLANLNSIKNNLIPDYLRMWENGSINDAQALSLAKFDAGWQNRLLEATKNLKEKVPFSSNIDRLKASIDAGNSYDSFHGSCKADKSMPCQKNRGDAFLRHDLFCSSWEHQCKGKECCLVCRHGKDASCDPCDYMCTHAKQARKDKRDQSKENEEARRRERLELAHDAVSKSAQRFLAAAEAAGLEDDFKLHLSAYSYFPISLLREVAEKKDGRTWYRNDLSTSFIDVADVAKQLRCSADYICGFSDDLHPIATPAWKTGTPVNAGPYYAKLSCDGHIVCATVSWDNVLGWTLGATRERVEADVIGWWPLPEKE